MSFYTTCSSCPKESLSIVKAVGSLLAFSSTTLSREKRGSADLQPVNNVFIKGKTDSSPSLFLHTLPPLDIHWVSRDSIDVGEVVQIRNAKPKTKPQLSCLVMVRCESISWNAKERYGIVKFLTNVNDSEHIVHVLKDIDPDYTSAVQHNLWMNELEKTFNMFALSEGLSTLGHYGFSIPEKDDEKDCLRCLEEQLGPKRDRVFSIAYLFGHDWLPVHPSVKNHVSIDFEKKNPDAEVKVSESTNSTSSGGGSQLSAPAHAPSPLPTVAEYTAWIQAMEKAKERGESADSHLEKIRARLAQSI